MWHLTDRLWPSVVTGTIRVLVILITVHLLFEWTGYASYITVFLVCLTFPLDQRIVAFVERKLNTNLEDNPHHGFD